MTSQSRYHEPTGCAAQLTISPVHQKNWSKYAMNPSQPVPDKSRSSVHQSLRPCSSLSTCAAKLTVKDLHGVGHRVHNSLHRCDPGHPAMKVVVRPKVPARQPHEQIVAHAKQPDEREVGKGDDARAISYVTQPLSTRIRPASR